MQKDLEDWSCLLKKQEFEIMQKRAKNEKNKNKEKPLYHDVRR
jgi:hypothetical protein